MNLDELQNRGMEHVRTLKLRVKDKHAAILCRMARDVNTVWNFVNETSTRAIRERQQFMSAYELQKYTAGYSACDGVTISSKTVAAVSDEYVTRRRQFKRTRLGWRVSNPKSARRSLGWVPVSRYVWPILLIVLAVDLGTVAVAVFTLHQAAERARSFSVDDLRCYSYAPRLGASVYLVARCTREELK